MRTETPPLVGVLPILITPFDSDDRVDRRALQAQVRFLADRGIRWAGIGFGSEVQRLTAAEVDGLVRDARAADDRIRIMGNADATSIPGGRDMIGRLHAAGAEAVLLRPPTVGGLGSAEVADALAAVATEAPLGVIVQDAAEMTGTALPAETVVRLIREVPAIRGAKIESRDAAAKITRIRELLPRGEGVLLGGSGGAGFALELARGADGTMPGPAFPELFLALHAAHNARDEAGARHIQTLLLPYLGIGGRSMETFIYSQKYALRRLGVLTETRLRPPHAVFDDGLLDAELEHLLQDLDAAATLVTETPA